MNRDENDVTFSHLASDGSASMVDVGSKGETDREASASAFVRMSAVTLAAVRDRALPKGDVLTVAQIAGIMAAKRTSELVPLTHPLALSHVDVKFDVEGDGIRVESTVRCHGRTGVEIEAMTACAIAALTIYDMCKSADKGIVIDALRLEQKSGGKSGDFRRAR